MQPLLRALDVRADLRDRTHPVGLLRGGLIPHRPGGDFPAIAIRLLRQGMVARGERVVADLRLNLPADVSCARITLLGSVTGGRIASSHTPATPVEVQADAEGLCLQFRKNPASAFTTPAADAPEISSLRRTGIPVRGSLSFVSPRIQCTQVMLMDKVLKVGLVLGDNHWFEDAFAH